MWSHSGRSNSFRLISSNFSLHDKQKIEITTRITTRTLSLLLRNFIKFHINSRTCPISKLQLSSIQYRTNFMLVSKRVWFPPHPSSSSFLHYFFLTTNEWSSGSTTPLLNSFQELPSLLLSLFIYLFIYLSIHLFIHLLFFFPSCGHIHTTPLSLGAITYVGITMLMRTR